MAIPPESNPDYQSLSSTYGLMIPSQQSFLTFVNWVRDEDTDHKRAGTEYDMLLKSSPPVCLSVTTFDHLSLVTVLFHVHPSEQSGMLKSLSARTRFGTSFSIRTTYCFLSIFLLADFSTTLSVHAHSHSSKHFYHPPYSRIFNPGHFNNCSGADRVN